MIADSRFGAISVFCETNTTRYAGGSKKAMPMSRKTSPPLIK